jgi:hypothetical protein
MRRKFRVSLGQRLLHIACFLQGETGAHTMHQREIDRRLGRESAAGW